MIHQNITVVSSWRSILPRPDSSSDSMLSGFQLSDKKNRLGISKIPNQVEHTNPCIDSGDEL